MEESEKLVVGSIKAYQKYIRYVRPKSPCKYSPSCSQYMIDAVEKHGTLKGVAKGAYRILRCNPFSKGGDDSA